MTDAYLRVKKWKNWQHYKDREPPWVKLHRKLLTDSDFISLTESEQWQLVRIWVVCSGSSQFALDDEQRRVPVVVDDEKTLRRAIGGLKRVPLARFISDGWLIVVPPDALLDPEPDQDASAVLANEPRNASMVLALPPQKTGLQGPKNCPDASTLLGLEVKNKPRSEDEPKNGSSSRVDELGMSVARNATVPTVDYGPPITPQALVAYFVDRSRELGGATPPGRVTGQVARLCGELLGEGMPAGSVQAGLELLLERRLHPSTLPSLVHEASLPRRSRGGRVTPSEILKQAEQLHAQEEAMFHHDPS